MEIDGLRAIGRNNRLDESGQVAKTREEEKFVARDSDTKRWRKMNERLRAKHHSDYLLNFIAG